MDGGQVDGNDLRVNFVLVSSRPVCLHTTRWISHNKPFQLGLCPSITPFASVIGPFVCRSLRCVPCFCTLQRANSGRSASPPRGGRVRVATPCPLALASRDGKRHSHNKPITRFSLLSPGSVDVWCRRLGTGMTASTATTPTARLSVGARAPSAGIPTARSAAGGHHPGDTTAAGEDKDSKGGGGEGKASASPAITFALESARSLMIRPALCHTGVLRLIDLSRVAV